MKKVLEVKNITKVYKIYKSSFDRVKEIFTKKIYHKEYISNKDISFDLFEGETLGIIGVNGAGKSTILKIIAEVISQTSGTVLKHGRVTALLELGTGFNQNMSGYDNIYLNGTLVGMTKKEIDLVIDDIIAFSELGDYIYEPILTYSSGMSMRLAFSIAIFSQPQILIVDEALSVGDAHFTSKCTKALKEKKEQDMSIIYVSHDLNSLKLLCDRILLLNHGEIIKQGNPEDVINEYNFLTSKLNDHEEKIVIQDIEKSSYGSFDIEIKEVSIQGKLSKCSIISSGEDAVLSIKIHSNVKVLNMTIGIMIRDKYGQDIFGTNTFHHDMIVNFEENSQYICTFEMPISIGSGKYSITAAIHSEDTHLEDCSHWLDNAADFEVAGVLGKTFSGLLQLHPQINFTKVAN